MFLFDVVSCNSLNNESVYTQCNGEIFLKLCQVYGVKPVLINIELSLHFSLEIESFQLLSILSARLDVLVLIYTHTHQVQATLFFSLFNSFFM